jgi:hypothetical protein
MLIYEGLLWLWEMILWILEIVSWPFVMIWKGILFILGLVNYPMMAVMKLFGRDFDPPWWASALCLLVGVGLIILLFFAISEYSKKRSG